MGINSRSDSNGSEKGRRSGFRISRKQSSVETSDVIKKEFTRITDSVKSAGKSIGSSLHSAISNVNNPKKETSVYSKGVPELDEYGYEKYNISDDTEIFISRVPERALFNEGEPIVERATMGNFVGPSITQSTSAHDESSQVLNSSRDKHELFPNVVFGDEGEKVFKADIGVVEGGQIRSTMDATNNLSEHTLDFGEDDDVNVVKKYSMEVESETEAEVPSVPTSMDAEVASVGVIESPVLDAVPDDMDEVSQDSDVSITVMDDVSEAKSEVVADETLSVREDAQVPVVADEVPEIKVEEPAPEEEPVDAAGVPETEDDDDNWKYIDIPIGDVEDAPAVESSESEAPVEEVVQVSTPVLPKAGIEIEGLYTEGRKETSEVVAAGSVISSSETEIAVTSSSAVSPKATPLPIKNLVEETVLPPMDDPKVHRPRSYRAMRFGKDGKLENVTDKKTESDEGLRGPFDRTVGQTVVRAGSVERLPPARPVRPRITIDDEVGGVMRLTLPELDLDDDSSTVEFGETVFPDDGLEEICFRDMDQVMMVLPVPEYPALPMADAVPAISAAEQIHAISAPAETALIPAAPEVEEEILDVASVTGSHAVVFSFGGNGSAGSVCFSF